MLRGSRLLGMPVPTPIRWGALGALVGFAVGLSAIAFAQPPPIDDGRMVVHANDGAVDIVFLGDSLTGSWFASSDSAGFRPQVIAAIEEQGFTVNASRADQEGGRVAEVAATANIPSDTDLVILELGTNDLWKTEERDFEEQYQDLVDMVRETAPDAALLCLGVWGNGDAARMLDVYISTPCTEAGGTFVPLWHLFVRNDTRGPAGVERYRGISDDFHPNDHGYDLIAGLVLSGLRIE
jgi:lysophospholipase L1-like esterase